MSAPATEARALRPSRLRALTGRLGTELRTEAVRGAALSLGLRLAISGANFLMLSLLARSMAAAEFGLTAFWFNATLFAAVAAGLGQERLFMRHWSEYAAEPHHARGAFRFGTVLTAGGAIVAALVVAASGGLSGDAPSLVVAASVFTAVAAVFTFTTHTARAVVSLAAGAWQDLTWRAVVIGAIGLAAWSRQPFDTVQFFAAATLGMAVGSAIQIAGTLRAVPATVRSAAPRLLPRLWLGRSWRTALGVNLEGAAQYLEVIAIGLVLTPTDAGPYFVAARLANIFLMIAWGMDGFTSRQIPRLHYGEGRGAVVATLRRLSAFTAVPVVVGLAGVALFGGPILGLFGPAFVAADPVLLALCLGTACLAFAGPSMPVLVLTGHEGAYSRIMAITLGVRLFAVAAGAGLAGPLGAACASAFVSTAGALALNAACRRLVGVDPSVGLLFCREARS